MYDVKMYSVVVLAEDAIKAAIEDVAKKRKASSNQQ